jgi:hypothetical protein
MHVRISSAMASTNLRTVESGCGHAWPGVQPTATRAGQRCSGYGHRVSQATRDAGTHSSSGWQQYREPMMDAMPNAVTTFLSLNG